MSLILFLLAYLTSACICTHVHTHTHTHTHILISSMFIGRLQIAAIRKVPSPSIVINCSTTGLPPTSIAWSRESVQLVNNQVYQLSQLLRDRATSAYSNLLTINHTLRNLKGIYSFAAISEQTGTNQSTSGPNSRTGEIQLCYSTI